MASSRIIAIYARQSIDKKDSVSIQAQIDKCKKRVKSIVKEEKLKVKVYEDKGFSGGDTNRPKLKELLNDISAGFVQTVVVYKIDRISRDVIDFYELYKIIDKANCTIISATESQIDTTTPQGSFNMDILVVFANLERQNLKSRIKDNFEYRYTIGAWCAGPAPFGFKNIRVNSVGQIEPIPEELEIVKKMFEKYEQDKTASVRSFQKWFADNGYTSKSGKKIGYSTISKILKNPLYVKADEHLYKYFKTLDYDFINAFSEWNGTKTAILLNSKEGEKKRVYLSSVSGVVDSRTFITVQKRLSQNQKFTSSNEPTHKAKELTGLLKCKYCGRAIKVNKSKNVYYIFCNGRMTYSGCTASFKGVRIDDLRDKVAVEVQKFLDDYDKRVQSRKDKVNRQRNKLKKLETELQNLIDVARTGKIASDVLGKDIEKHQAQINDLQLEINLGVNNSDLVDFRLGIKGYEAGRRIEYALLDEQTRQSILKILVQKIFVDSSGNIEVIFNDYY